MREICFGFILILGLSLPHGMDGAAVTGETLVATDSHGLIKIEYIIRKIDNIAIYQGALTWTKASGAGGKPAMAPIRLFYNARKGVVPVCGYEPGPDGKFWLLVPDTTGKYSLKVFTELSKDMPEKAKEVVREAGQEKP